MKNMDGGGSRVIPERNGLERAVQAQRVIEF